MPGGPPTKRRRGAVLSPSRGAGLPCRPQPRRVCLQETGAKKQQLLWRSHPQMERGGIPPCLPSPHLITSHQHLRLTTPREKPADTGRGKCRGRPWQAEPGRGGHETLARASTPGAAMLAFLSSSQKQSHAQTGVPLHLFF